MSSEAGFPVPENYATVTVKDEEPSVLESVNRNETQYQQSPEESTNSKAEFPVSENYATLIVKDEEPPIFDSGIRNETVHQQSLKEGTIIKSEFPVPENYVTVIVKEEESSLSESESKNETIYKQSPEEGTINGVRLDSKMTAPQRRGRPRKSSPTSAKHRRLQQYREYRKKLVNIGSAYDDWATMKMKLGFQKDEELANYLIQYHRQHNDDYFPRPVEGISPAYDLHSKRKSPSP